MLSLLNIYAVLSAVLSVVLCNADTYNTWWTSYSSHWWYSSSGDTPLQSAVHARVNQNAPNVNQNQFQLASKNNQFQSLPDLDHPNTDRSVRQSQTRNEDRARDDRIRDDVDDRPVWGQDDSDNQNRPSPALVAEPAARSTQKTESSPKIDEVEKPLKVPSRMKKWLITPSLKHCLSYCKYPSGVPFVSGGENAHLHEFPHMTALGFGSGEIQGRSLVAWHNCGGSLISKNFILTAAHCIDSSTGPPTQVRLGEHDLSRQDETISQDFPILSIIVHPGYNSSNNLYNDIALIKLATDVTFSKHIRPVCLHNGADVRGNEKGLPVPIAITKAVATGWGHISFADAPSDILQKVSLDIIDQDKCRQLQKPNAYIPQGVVDSQICAGVLAGGKDTCSGDSGGPLQVNNTVFSIYRICPMELVGITSFGTLCAEANSPGVYTRVSYYRPWIESIVWPGYQ